MAAQRPALGDGDALVAAGHGIGLTRGATIVRAGVGTKRPATKMPEYSPARRTPQRRKPTSGSSAGSGVTARPAAEASAAPAGARGSGAGTVTGAGRCVIRMGRPMSPMRRGGMLRE